jgi:chlorobactene glucosyltransferase
MSGVLDIFRERGRLSRPLLACFLAVLTLLVLNAFLHDPTAGYDAQDHLHYVQSLADHWRLPTKFETGQYYAPPLPYVLPALLTAFHAGIWKALKFAQLFNVLLAGGLMLYLLKTCELVAPQNTRLKILCIALLGLLPVFYRSFALVRGEPYLAFFGVYVAHESLALVLKRKYSAARVIVLGAALGLSILARQWGFFLFPPILLFAAWMAFRKGGDCMQAVGAATASLLIALLAGGWFYVHIARQYGTLTAFDRAPQPLGANASSLLSIDTTSARLFSDPIRPSLGSRLLPILYADTWGDYWGYFLVYARNVQTGEFEDGAVFQKLTTPTQFSLNFTTNRFDISNYLGTLNLLDIIPTALFLLGLISGCLAVARFVRGRARDNLDHAMALFAMIALSSVLGYLWFILRYQTPKQAGDLIKATYMLQAFPAFAFLAAVVTDKVWDRRPTLGRILGVAFGLLFVAEMPAFITHYVHLSATPGVILLALSTVLFGASLSINRWIHGQYQLNIVVEPVPPRANAPLISVCVPARNEAANIRACVEALLAQTYPQFEVLVLDDRSTDATPEILKGLADDPRLHVLHGSELPEDWAGKPHALTQAAAAARGDWLCFVDADTFATPYALASCHAKAVATKADLFTIMTRQITGTFWEKTVLPLVMTALAVGFPARDTNDPEKRTAIANGQFILIRRSVYEALGGHARIKDQIVEDKALAELVKWNGYRLIVADGRLVASTRMYSSLPQMWEGWTKNIYLGLRGQPGLAYLGAIGALILVIAAFFLPLWPLLGALWLLNGGGWLAIAVILEALVVWGAVFYSRARAARSMGISGWYALTTPLGAGVFAAMMAASAWKIVSGRGVTWRGRRYNPAR